MQVAEWQAQPQPPPTKKEPKRPATADELVQSADELVKSIDDFASGRFDDRHTYAVLMLKNNSDKVVTNIRVKFKSYSADVLLDREDDKDDVFQTGVKEIAIPEMKQGDELTYRLWTSGSSPEYLKSDIDTFSSSGPVRMTYVFPESEWETEQSTLEWIIEDVFPWVGAALLTLMAILAAIFAHHYETLIKALLKDKSIYEEEREKFESDPAKYSPATWTLKPKA